MTPKNNTDKNPYIVADLIHEHYVYDSIEDYPIQTPDQIILRWASLQNELGFPVRINDLEQFNQNGSLVSKDLITFIMLKQKELFK